MKLDDIYVSDFRNISHGRVEWDSDSTVLIGENAQGKTNLVEAVYLLACAKSFRTSRYRDLIRHGCESAKIVATVSGEGLPFEIRMELDAKEGKAIYKNGIRLRKLSEFLGLFRVVLFCPEHLSLIKDGPGKRRSFVDSAICQLRPYYASLLNEFNKTEAQRAALLKQLAHGKGSRELLSVWNERMAEISVKIAYLRADYIKRLGEAAPLHFHRISGGKETFSLVYQSDVYRPEEESEGMKCRYLALLDASLSSDLKYGFTQKGIHRDDLELLIDGYSARNFASQGQQRSAVLSLKLAEGEISRMMTGQEPVYLLDDVLSELDENRRTYITGGLEGKQVILTGTDRDQFSFVKKKITVSGGTFCL